MLLEHQGLLYLLKLDDLGQFQGISLFQKLSDHVILEVAVIHSRC
jgi:hypothetical protein